MPDNKNTPDTSNVNHEVDSEETDNQPSYMTAEQFNKALSSREKAFEKRLARQQEEFQKLIERLAPPPKEEPQLSRTAELERSVKDLSKQLQERDAREKAGNLRKVAEQALRAHGIDAEFTEHALAYLVDAKQAIKYDEDGNVIMVLNGMAYESLDEGMAAWAQSRDAKLYKKPTSAQGSGDSNRTNRGGAPAQFDKNRQIELKRRPEAMKNFNVHDPQSSLDKQSKVALQQILVQKLAKHQ